MLCGDPREPVRATHCLYSNHVQAKGGWRRMARSLGPPLGRISDGLPLIHEFLKALGVLESDGKHLDDSFEEEFNILRQRFLADNW